MPGYEAIGTGVGALVERKQQAYGDSFSKTPEILKILYPDGISANGMSSLLTVVRVLDKLSRIAQAQGEPDLMSENPWRDIAGYAVLELGRQSPNPGDANTTSTLDISATKPLT